MIVVLLQVKRDLLLEGFKGDLRISFPSWWREDRNPRHCWVDECLYTSQNPRCRGLIRAYAGVGRECSILWQGRVWSRRKFAPKTALEINLTCRASIQPADYLPGTQPNGITEHRRTPILRITRLMAKNHKAGNEFTEIW